MITVAEHLWQGNAGGVGGYKVVVTGSGGKVVMAKLVVLFPSASYFKYSEYFLLQPILEKMDLKRFTTNLANTSLSRSSVSALVEKK